MLLLIMENIKKDIAFIDEYNFRITEPKNGNMPGCFGVYKSTDGKETKVILKLSTSRFSCDLQHVAEYYCYRMERKMELDYLPTKLITVSVSFLEKIKSYEIDNLSNEVIYSKGIIRKDYDKSNAKIINLFVLEKKCNYKYNCRTIDGVINSIKELYPEKCEYLIDQFLGQVLAKIYFANSDFNFCDIFSFWEFTDGNVKAIPQYDNGFSLFMGCFAGNSILDKEESYFEYQSTHDLDYVKNFAKETFEFTVLLGTCEDKENDNIKKSWKELIEYISVNYPNSANNFYRKINAIDDDFICDIFNSLYDEGMLTFNQSKYYSDFMTARSDVMKDIFNSILVYDNNKSEYSN